MISDLNLEVTDPLNSWVQMSVLDCQTPFIKRWLDGSYNAAFLCS